MKKKKLFYVPGLVSLLGLPVLLFLFPLKNEVRHNAIKLNLPAEDGRDDTKDGILRFSKASIEKSLTGKKVEQVYLDDHSELYDDDIDKYLLSRKMVFIRSEMERLQFTHDTSTVLKVTFENENTYGHCVAILNLCILNRFRRYALADNDFYLFANEPPAPYLPADLPVYSDISDLDTATASSITNRDIFWWEIEYRIQLLVYEIKENKLLCTGFLVLIVIPFLINLFRFRRNRTVRKKRTFVA